MPGLAYCLGSHVPDWDILARAIVPEIRAQQCENLDGRSIVKFNGQTVIDVLDVFIAKCKEAISSWRRREALTQDAYE